MRGAVFLGNRRIEIRNFPDPAPGAGEVVIRMKASGMCGSDLKFYRPPPGEAQKALGLGGNAEPFIAGHEPCGVVAARGPGVSEREAPIGQRVMDHHYAGCGVCGHCRVGWSQLCREGITVYGVTANGGHAEYLKVPARTLVPLPDELSFAEGAAVACGTGTAYGALRRMQLRGGATPAPRVSALISFSIEALEEFRTTSAPNCFASARRSSLVSMAITRAPIFAPSSVALMPTGPWPNTASVAPPPSCMRSSAP